MVGCWFLGRWIAMFGKSAGRFWCARFGCWWGGEGCALDVVAKRARRVVLVVVERVCCGVGRKGRRVRMMRIVRWMWWRRGRGGLWGWIW